MQAAADSGLSGRAFNVYWTLRADADLKEASIDPMALAHEAETQLGKFPNAAVNSDEKRRLRAALYHPLLKLSAVARARGGRHDRRAAEGLGRLTWRRNTIESNRPSAVARAQAIPSRTCGSALWPGP
jgi:hypothetical protein